MDIESYYSQVSSFDSTFDCGVELASLSIWAGWLDRIHVVTIPEMPMWLVSSFDTCNLFNHGSSYETHSELQNGLCFVAKLHKLISNSKNIKV